MNKLSLILIFALILILQNVEALSLGTLVKKDFASIKPNESAKFEILFWNVENKAYQVQLEVEEAPKDWFILIQPNEFSLDSSTGEEYITLPYLEKPINAFQVKVFVKPEKADLGEYQIHIRAKAGIPSKSIAFFQEREFKLTVKVEGEKIQDAENKSLTIPQEEFPFTGKIIEQASSILSYILAIIGILVISALIYKYA